MLRQIIAIIIVTLAISATITHGQQCPSSFCGSGGTQSCCSFTQINSTTVEANCCVAPTSCCLTNQCCPSGYPVCCNGGYCCPGDRFCCIVDGANKCCSMSKTDGAYPTDPHSAQGSALNLVKRPRF